MTASTALIVGEMVRLGAAYVEGQDHKILTIDLYRVYDGSSRARGQAKFQVTARFEWDPVDGFARAFDLVDTRGYPVKWSWAQVGAWLVKSLPGSWCVVNVQISDAGAIPPAWTESRLEAQAARLAKLDPVAIRAAAAAKRVTANKMADGSARKGDLLASAGYMDETAQSLDDLRALG